MTSPLPVTQRHQCIAPDCTKISRSPTLPRYCEMHYYRLRRVGSLDVERPHDAPLTERLARYTPAAPASECWEWTGTRNQHGYGRLDVDGSPRYAHRLWYEVHHGPIPEGLVVMHSCDNPPCVNPAHLSVGTHLDNWHDCIAKGRDVNSKRRAAAAEEAA